MKEVMQFQTISGKFCIDYLWILQCCDVTVVTEVALRLLKYTAFAISTAIKSIKSEVYLFTVILVESSLLEICESSAQFHRNLTFSTVNEISLVLQEIYTEYFFNNKSRSRLVQLGHISCLKQLCTALNSSLFTQDEWLSSTGLEDFSIMLRVSITE